ncbi:hypothetical protein PISMIDRAFT_487297 [Pisolithus microcarpus 441]|uniref:Uncharacterized protein n=1 Tax=Pisolithus microcarpus 441 TaxID=765257 RepID=A0A0C9YWX1_9AGAM|nr:hypothetical protein PISMIDRAFT_487297 [Pisolithus microcarpus 441]
MSSNDRKDINPKGRPSRPQVSHMNRNLRRNSSLILDDEHSSWPQMPRDRELAVTSSHSFCRVLEMVFPLTLWQRQGQDGCQTDAEQIKALGAV